MNSITEQHYGEVVSGKSSFLLHAGGPPHQQGVLQPYEQPANVKSTVSLSVHSKLCTPLYLSHNLKGKAL